MELRPVSPTQRHHPATSPGEEHWHGGTVDNMMCHLAMLEGTESGDSTTWLEPVSDEQYAAAKPVLTAVLAYPISLSADEAHKAAREPGVGCVRGFRPGPAMSPGRR
jgi:hypothetical protein